MQAKVKFTTKEIEEMCKEAVYAQSSWIVLSHFTYLNDFQLRGDRSVSQMKEMMASNYSKRCCQHLYEAMGKKLGIGWSDGLIKTLERNYKDDLLYASEIVSALTIEEFRKSEEMYSKVTGFTGHLTGSDGYFKSIH